MPKKFTVSVDVEMAEELLQAIDDRKETLNKVGGNLLKKKCGDAAKPIFAMVDSLALLAEEIRTAFNRSGD